MVARASMLHLVPDPPRDEPSPLGERVERLIAECVEMRERAARTTRSAHALLDEARLLLLDARQQRALSVRSRFTPVPPAGFRARRR